MLLSGDINGRWNALFKRVTAVNKSNGPFDILLCTGRTFADAGDTPLAFASSSPQRYDLCLNEPDETLRCQRQSTQGCCRCHRGWS